MKRCRRAAILSEMKTLYSQQEEPISERENN
jgi:hypothetical protein